MKNRPTPAAVPQHSPQEERLLRYLAGFPGPDTGSTSIGDWDAISIGNKRLSELTSGDILEGLEFQPFWPFLVPMGLRIVEENAIIEARYCAGDLLKALTRVGRDYWLENGEDYAALSSVLTQIEDVIPAIAEFRGKMGG